MKSIGPCKRRSIRLKGYDYTQVGAYFLTICTDGKELLFGEINGATIVLNELGRIVSDSWEWLFHQYRYVGLDARVIMPNHIHWILIMKEDPVDYPSVSKQKTLGSLVGAFKTFSTMRINDTVGTPGCRVWQRNYYEHVIRTEEEMNRIRRYIIDNPLQWDLDRENPLKEGNHPLDHLFYKKRKK